MDQVRVPVGAQLGRCAQPGHRRPRTAPQLVDALEGGPVLQSGTAQRGVVPGHVQPLQAALPQLGQALAGRPGVGDRRGVEAPVGDRCPVLARRLRSAAAEHLERTGVSGLGGQHELQVGLVRRLVHDRHARESDGAERRCLPAKHACGGCQYRVQQQARGQHRGPVHAVVAQVPEAVEVDATGPVVGARLGGGVDERLQHRVAARAWPPPVPVLVVEPVPLPLPGIGRQLHHRDARAVDPAPLDRVAGAVELGERLQDGGPPRHVTVQRRHHDPVALLPLQAFGDRAAEHRVRRDLDERVVPGVHQGGDRPVEKDRLAQVGRPVPGVESASVDGAPGDRGDHRNRRRVRIKRGQRPPKLVLQRRHLRAVRGEVDRFQDPAGDPVSLQRGDQVPHRVRGAGEHRDLRAVVRGHRHGRRVVPGENLPRPSQGKGGHRHLPLADSGADHPAAVQRNQQRVVQGQSAGHVCRGDLADAVPDDGTGLHAPRPPQLRQGHLHRAQGGLADGRVGQAGAVPVSGELLDQGPVGVPPQQLVAAFQDVAHDRLGLDEVGGQRPPPRTLAGEHERDPRAAAHLPVAREQPRVFRARRERGQSRPQLIGRAADDGQPVLVMRAAHRRGGAHSGGRGLVVQPPRVPPGQLAQRVLGTGGDRQHVRRIPDGMAGRGGHGCLP